jgi:HD domain
MRETFYDELTAQYNAYVQSFQDESGNLPAMMQLKVDHTHRVVEDARRIMAGEGWNFEDVELGEAAALLHDTARYSQFKAFKTFKDRDSFDHAARAVRIIHEQGWLQELTEAERRAILVAVAVHNKREIPAAVQGRDLKIACLVRDADKLDILHLLEQAVKDGSLERNPEIAWGLQMKGAPDTRLVEAVASGHTVSYDWIHCFADFVLIQVGWLNGGLSYGSSARLVQERRVLEFREEFLKRLTEDHAGIDRCCRAARTWLKNNGAR